MTFTCAAGIEQQNDEECPVCGEGPDSGDGCCGGDFDAADRVRKDLRDGKIDIHGRILKT